MLTEIFACFAISTGIHTFPSCYKGHSVFEGGSYSSFLLPSAVTTVKGINHRQCAPAVLHLLLKVSGKRAGSQSPCKGC